MKERLDVLLVKRNLAESREKAKAIIMSGNVFVEDQREDKAGTTFPEDVKIEVRGHVMPYVSRGGLKLEKAIKKFDVSVIGGPHYSSDTKFGLGLVAAGLYRTDRNDSLLPPSNVSLYGDVSTVGFYLLGVRGNHLFPQDKYRLNYNLYFYSFPSLYWGRGYDNGANSDNESDYKRFQAQVKVDFMFRMAKNFYIGPLAVFDYIDGRD